MKKPVLYLISAIMLTSSVSMANELLRSIRESESFLKSSIAIQYTCGKNFGWTTFAKDKFTMNFLNMTHMKQGAYSSTLISSGNSKHSTLTKAQMEALKFIPENVKGFRAVGPDGLEDVILTLESEVSTEVNRENAVVASKELTEEVITKGRLTHVNHKTGAVEAEDCDVVLHKCEGVACATRVVLVHYNKSKEFKPITLDRVEHSKP